VKTYDVCPLKKGCNVHAASNAFRRSFFVDRFEVPLLGKGRCKSARICRGALRRSGGRGFLSVTFGVEIFYAARQRCFFLTLRESSSTRLVTRTKESWNYASVLAPQSQERVAKAKAWDAALFFLLFISR